MVTFSMVYHIRAEGDKFVKEKGLAFLSGRNPKNVDPKFRIIDDMIKSLLTVRMRQWQDISEDHLPPDAGITPRLFVGALLSQYGTTVSANVEKTAELLLDFDATLSEAVAAIQNGEAEGESDEHICKATKEIQLANKSLVTMTQKLTGIKSTMHFLAESAQVLVKGITPFHEYIDARLDDWMDTAAPTRLDDQSRREKQPHSERAMSSQLVPNSHSGTLKQSLKQLDIVKEHLRDKDKLIMVRNNLFQYKQDIKGLLQHIDLNIGMVQYPRAV